MRVRRVRLLDALPGARQEPVQLAEPRARRAPARLDRVRVRSVWLGSEEGELRTRWGWRPEAVPGAPAERKPAAPGVAAAETPPDGFLPALRELLRPNVRAILSREEWPHPLYPFQEDGVLFLYERPGALLADDMGLGKTIQTLAAISLLLSTGQITQATVLCPAPLVLNWRREARRWLPRLEGGIVAIAGDPVRRLRLWRSRAPLLIAGFETFRSDYAADRLPERLWDLLVLDEAQRIKNDDTELARACKALPRKRSWALTGTPLENRIEELESILEFVTSETASPAVGLHGVRAKQQAHQLRRTKEGVALELPPKTVVNVLLELTERQRATYDQLEKDGIVELRERGETLRVTHVLGLLTRLKQVCNFCPASGESVKLEYLTAQLNEIRAAGRQALVFSQFTDDQVGLRRLASEIEGLDLFHGGMSHTARDAAVQRFQAGETGVLGISLRAGGVGLNLQRASYVFHFDRWWNPAVEWQAEDRAHRLGQELPVTVYRLVTAGTIEERVHAILSAKEELFRHVVEGAPAPAESGLTVEELFGLLELPPGKASN
ncbi:MAG: ATP-dependent helicase HepA [Armatimonadetes bacterium]|nr:ATP-dependent helicase HepA [Armatimonadota bacterium]